jgi:hypothetical protein
MGSVEIGPAITGSLSIITIKPAHALVAAYLIIASLQCRFAITTGKTCLFCPGVDVSIRKKKMFQPFNQIFNM